MAKGILEQLSEGVVLGDGGYIVELEQRGWVTAGAFTPERSENSTARWSTPELTYPGNGLLWEQGQIGIRRQRRPDGGGQRDGHTRGAVSSWRSQHNLELEGRRC